MGEPIRGKEALEALAKCFPQLYVPVSEDSAEAYARAARRGVAPDNANLAHFQGSDDDELVTVDTPAGPIEVLFLSTRSDFETFLQIIGHKACPVPILPEVGAITFRGLADWMKVASALRAYTDAGGTDLAAEYARLAAEPGAIRSELIVISAGPYSNVPAHEAGYDEAEWLRVSRDIRLYHECAHVVCRRLMPDDILPVWDEVTADVVGLICATGGYDPELAARFLGVGPQGYAGGRLEEYLDKERRDRIDSAAEEAYAAQLRVAEMVSADDLAHPFDFLLALKRKPLLSF